MKVPFLDITTKLTAERESLHQALDRVIDSRVFILGKEVEAFEAALAADLGVEASRAVSCNSGTDGLVLSLKVMGVAAGDEVIVPSHTAIPTVTAIRALGAVPVFADIDPETWVLDPADALGRVTSKTRAIVAVHLYGNMVDLGALATHRHLVLEDVAQAQGAAWNGVSAGTWGRCGAYSFYPTKNLGALGDGGALVCASAEDGARARSLRFYGQNGRYRAEHDGGVNSRLDEIQAAFLRVRLATYRQELAAKDRLRALYETELAGLPLRFQRVTKGCRAGWHLLVVALEKAELRERVRLALEGAGIGSLVHYPVPNHLQPAFASFRTRPLTVTERLCERILSLPFHAYLSQQDLAVIVAVIRRACA